jgi:hypothetical protein
MKSFAWWWLLAMAACTSGPVDGGDVVIPPDPDDATCMPSSIVTTPEASIYLGTKSAYDGSHAIDVQLPTLWAGDHIDDHVDVQVGWTSACTLTNTCSPTEPVVYGQCAMPPSLTASVTSPTPSVVAIFDDGRESGLASNPQIPGGFELYTVKVLAQGDVTIHVELGGTGSQSIAVDEVLHVLHLDDIRFRCYVGPGYTQEQSCASVAAGTPLAIVYDGLAGSSYHDIAATVAWAGPDANPSPECVGVELPGDSDWSTRCTLPAGLTQPVTITVSAHGLTRSATIAVE